MTLSSFTRFHGNWSTLGEANEYQAQPRRTKGNLNANLQFPGEGETQSSLCRERWMRCGRFSNKKVKETVKRGKTTVHYCFFLLKKWIDFLGLFIFLLIDKTELDERRRSHVFRLNMNLKRLTSLHVCSLSVRCLSRTVYCIIFTCCILVFPVPCFLLEAIHFTVTMEIYIKKLIFLEGK